MRVKNKPKRDFGAWYQGDYLVAVDFLRGDESMYNF
jgi:hypothetical protein